MRKVLSLTLGAGVVLLLFFLLLGCGGGRSAPTAIGPTVGSAQAPDLPQGAGNFVGVPYQPSGSVDASLQRRIAIASSGTASETRVTISAEEVTDLTNFTFELRYDPDLYNPVNVEYGEFMPSGDDLITFSYTDEPGVVSIAKVFIHPDEAVGVSGSGTLATVTFENRPYAGAKSVATLPGGGTPVDDFAIDPDVVDPDMGVMWTTSFFRGDGNQDSMVNISDLTLIAAHFNELISEHPEADVANYNSDPVVNISDISMLAANFQTTVGQFDVRVATDAEDGTYSSNGTLAWEDASGTTEGGFNEYHYTLTGDYSSFDTIWVRVWYFDSDPTPNESEQSDYVVFYPGGPPPTPEISIVPGTGYGAIEIQIENTTNTTGGDRDGTDFYAPVQGTPATGDVIANDAVTLRLTGIHYLYAGNAYGIGEAALYPDQDDYPEFGDTVTNETAYNNIIAVLQELLVADEDTEFVSTEGDPEAFDEVPKVAGDRDYSGTIGPNAPSAIAPPPPLTVLTANAYVTPPVSMTNNVEQTFFAAVDLNVLEDGFAPEVWHFMPDEMPVNKELKDIGVELDFGWDDWDPEDNPLGTNTVDPYTKLPTAVQLINMSEGIVVEFTPAAPDDWDPPNEDAPNTIEHPERPLTYTYQISEIHRPGEPEGEEVMPTMIMQVYLSTGQVQGDYFWRIIETEQRGDPPADVQIRSSLKQPDLTFTVTGPEYLNIVTHPLDDVYPGEPSAFIYLLPEDPKVRLNPVGHEDVSPSGVTWAPNDETKFEIIKRDGAEFVPQPFDMINNEPESPSSYYVMGDTPPSDPEHGNHLPTQWLQPHALGVVTGPIIAETLPGHVSIALFDRQGNMLAQVTRNFVAAPVPPYRDRPVIDSTTDFGVNVWDSTPPDFSSKVAHKGALDIVVFQVKNLWIRHKPADDAADPGNTGSHLILQLQPSGAELNPIQVIPRMLSTSPLDPCLVSIDPSEVYFWHNPNPQALQNGQWEVWFENAGAGRSFESYQDTGLDFLSIAP